SRTTFPTSSSATWASSPPRSAPHRRSPPPRSPTAPRSTSRQTGLRFAGSPDLRDGRGARCPAHGGGRDAACPRNDGAPVKHHAPRKCWSPSPARAGASAHRAVGGRWLSWRPHLVDGVLGGLPIRQWVLTLPHRLRYALAWDHRLCRAVLAAFGRAVLGF